MLSLPRSLHGYVTSDASFAKLKMLERCSRSRKCRLVSISSGTAYDQEYSKINTILVISLMFWHYNYYD